MRKRRDNIVQKKASLHEKSVQSIAKNEIKKSQKTRGLDKRRRTTTLMRLKVDETIMKMALELANGDAARILILSARSVIVLNHKDQFKNVKNFQ